MADEIRVRANDFLLGFVEQDVRRSSVVADNSIESTIIIDVSHGETATDPGFMKDVTRDRRDNDKLLPPIFRASNMGSW